MIIGNRKFENYTYIFAIVNLTPDSFYAPSRNTEYTVLKTVEGAVKDGAAVIDIGAQSTRPGYTEVSADEEISRLMRPLELIKRNFDIPVSVDTYFSETAKAALSAGADMINDVWGLSRDGDMAETVAAWNASVCIMHNSRKQVEGDVVQAVKKFLISSAQKAEKAGIPRDKICLDGGIGFAKDGAQSLELLNRYKELSPLGYPLLLGASRKSLFGGRVEDRLGKTLASTRSAAENKILFVRVHDVKENAQVIREVYERS